MQSLAVRHDDWVPPVVKTVASEGKGLEDLAKAVANYQEFLSKSEIGKQKRVQNWRDRLIEMLRDTLLERVMREQNGRVDAYAAEIAEHKRDPYSLVEEIVGGK
jgi:LAO/AO transport system kinase